jgi:hypothetical protein
LTAHHRATKETVPGVTFGVLADKQGHLIGVAAN